MTTAGGRGAAGATTTGTAGDAATNARNGAAVGGSGGGGLGGLFGPPGGFGGFSGAGGASGAGVAGTGGPGGAGGLSGGMTGGGYSGAYAVCPPNTQTAITSPIIADFSAASGDGLPILTPPYRAVVVGNATGTVKDGAWHVVGSAAANENAYVTGLGARIEFGCVDMSAYSGISFTIVTSGSSCPGVSMQLFDANGGYLNDFPFVPGGQTKTTVKLPVVSWGGETAMSTLAWLVTEIDASCTFDWTIDDVTFYKDTGGGGNGGAAGVSGTGGMGGSGASVGGSAGPGGIGGSGLAGGAGSGIGGRIPTCPPDVGTSISNPVIADFSSADADGLPIFQSPYRPLFYGNVTAEVKDGVWQIVGNETERSPPWGPTIGVGIDFGCIDTSAYSGISFSIDTSGSNCWGVSAEILDWYGTYVYREGLVLGETKTTVSIPEIYLRTALRTLRWIPFGGDQPCTFEWKIDDVTFYR